MPCFAWTREGPERRLVSFECTGGLEVRLSDWNPKANALLGDVHRCEKGWFYFPLTRTPAVDMQIFVYLLNERPIKPGMTEVEEERGNARTTGRSSGPVSIVYLLSCSISQNK